MDHVVSVSVCVHVCLLNPHFFLINPSSVFLFFFPQLIFYTFAAIFHLDMLFISEQNYLLQFH